MLPGPWSKARLTTPNLLNGSARCDFTSTLSKLTCYSNCPFRWQMPSSTMALSTWVFRTSWFRRPSLTVAIWRWHRLWRPGLGARHLVSYFTDWDGVMSGVVCFILHTKLMVWTHFLFHGFYILKSLISCFVLFCFLPPPFGFFKIRFLYGFGGNFRVFIIYIHLWLSSSSGFTTN